MKAFLLIAPLIILAATAHAGDRIELTMGSLSVSLDSTTGNLVSMESPEGRIPIGAAGAAFTAWDYKARKELPLSLKKLTRLSTPGAEGIMLTCAGDGFSCRVMIRLFSGGVRMEGHLINESDTDKAIVLSYVIPLFADGLTFSSSLNGSVVVDGDRRGSGTVYPIATMCGKSFGLAVAIPPTDPAMFRASGSSDGLTLSFYLGLPAMRGGQSRSAPFGLVVYPCDARWGFRDALRRYYSFFPGYYMRQVKGDGLWLFQAEGRDIPNIRDYMFDEAAMVPEFGAVVDRDDKLGILTFPYMIVGQREIKHLETLPDSYEDAISVFNQWTPPPPGKFPDTKENLASGLDAYLREEVLSSAIMNSDGRYHITLRNTPWGGNSITWTMNPNPELFSDQRGVRTTGSEALFRIRQWLDRYPGIDGIYIDSLGSNWCARLNYRRDHFNYARYPLTFDKDGNIALHNMLSHYEFLVMLRSELARKGKFLFANGIYNYSPKEPEYADVTECGRFFLASLLDVAGCESGSPSMSRWEFYRACMGKKPYLILRYSWDKPESVEDFLNEALLYDVFGTCSSGFEKDYWKDPAGYARLRGLYDWFLPLARALSKAGWEPVTHASSPTKGVRFERYGERGDIYFTLYNPGPERECVLRVEIRPLGLSKKARVEQISGKGFIGADREDDSISIRTRLGPKRTAVIRLTEK